MKNAIGDVLCMSIMWWPFFVLWQGEVNADSGAFPIDFMSHPDKEHLAKNAPSALQLAKRFEPLPPHLAEKQCTPPPPHLAENPSTPPPHLAENPSTPPPHLAEKPCAPPPHHLAEKPFTPPPHHLAEKPCTPPCFLAVRFFDDESRELLRVTDSSRVESYSGKRKIQHIRAGFR